MVTDKLTLSLLSRLADAQLALATSMKGVVPGERYPAQPLGRISEALDVIEASLVEIGQLSPGRNSDNTPKLH